MCTVSSGLTASALGYSSANSDSFSFVNRKCYPLTVTATFTSLGLKKPAILTITLKTSKDGSLLSGTSYLMTLADSSSFAGTSVATNTNGGVTLKPSFDTVGIKTVVIVGNNLYSSFVTLIINAYPLVTLLTSPAVMIT